jgi:hypothetical protein
MKTFEVDLSARKDGRGVVFSYTVRGDTKAEAIELAKRRCAIEAYGSKLILLKATEVAKAARLCGELEDGA